MTLRFLILDTHPPPPPLPPALPHQCVTFVAEVGAAALKFLPKGGLYVSGGIAAKNPHWVQSEVFLHAFKDKGRLSSAVEQTPLYLVLVEDTGERGAHYASVQLLFGGHTSLQSD